MGVDGRDERHDGGAGAGAHEEAPSGQVPDPSGPGGTASPAGERAGRTPRADGSTSAAHVVPRQRRRDGRKGPESGREGGELPPSDAQLLADLRAGDDSAYEEMYRRHAPAVRGYARGCCRDADTAEDLTGEVFARTLQAVRGGAGPDSAVRAYLLTTLRRVAASWAKTARREQLVEDFAVFAVSAAGSPGEEKTLDPGAEVRAMQEAERSLAVQAFRSLPERYQTVLWHTTVEDESPSEVAPLLGLTANATAVLAHRAREGLKQAYLQAHVSQSLTAGGDCARYADRLGAYARGGLRMRAERGLRRHLAECTRCRLAALEVEDVNQRIGALLPVAVIGWLAAGYAVKTAVAGAAGAGAATAAGLAGGGSGASGGPGAAGGAAAGNGLSTSLTVGLGVGAAAVAGTVLALSLTGLPHRAAEPQARSARPVPAAPREPAPAPSHPERPTGHPGRPTEVAAAPKPPSPHPQKPTHKQQPAPSSSAPEPQKPPSTPARPSPPADPSPTRPSPGGTPSKPAPKPPLPSLTTYQLNQLVHDFMGDGSKPEVRSGSGWLWPRRAPAVDGTTYAHGVSVPALSSVTIDLNRSCTAYDAVVGVDDLSMGPGALRFSVYADGVRLWRSPAVRRTEAGVPVHLPLAGHHTLQLVTEPAGPGAVALGDWAQSTISCR
ncbi:sigma-70 family RNA polymerase sigma factor [Streptomyces sioyaensis]|uniref:sigma-70 family RNA polymerase sigma factor n=1 Tax=Streptomyces sioyaensis TaxID=67364 RepID=UPI003690B538